MAPVSNYSMPVRVTALGFIFTIFFGNLWIVCLLFGIPLPMWIGYMFYLGVLLALGGGLAMLVNKVADQLQAPRDGMPDDRGDN